MRLRRAPAPTTVLARFTWLALLLAYSGCRGRAIGKFNVGDAFTAPVNQPNEEPNEVHFTFTGPTSVTFDWRGNGSTMTFWAKEVPPRVVQARTPDPKPFSSPGPWQEAELTGLVPGVEYQYVIGRPKQPIPTSLRAPPPRGSAGFVFAAMGDVGASVDWPETRAVHRLISLAEPAFVIMLGDLTYADIRAQPSADRHFEDVMAWSLRAAYMPVWGNHEWEDPRRDDLRNYKGRFALPHAQASPGAPAPGCCGEDWYWFDYGNIRFITYPEPYAEGTLDDWAARAEPLFAEAEKDRALQFVVTAGHRPAYSSGHHGGEPKLRQLLDGFGRRFPKYVLSLSGHSHVYERTKPQAHVVHISAGIGGSVLEHAATSCLWKDCTPPAFTAFRAIHHGFLKIAVRPGELQVETICGAAAPGNNDIRCAEGEIMDHATIPAAAESGR
jgi:hypothetical protein